MTARCMRHAAALWIIPERVGPARQAVFAERCAAPDPFGVVVVGHSGAPN